MTGQRNVKLLGIKIDNKLDFNDHVSMIYKKPSRKLNNKINRLHKRALHLVYKNSTLSFNQLLTMDNLFTVHQRNLQQLATEIYQIINYLNPRFMKSIFPLSSNHNTLHKASTFQTDNFKTVRYVRETLAFRGPLIWESVPIDIKNIVYTVAMNSRDEQSR